MATFATLNDDILIYVSRYLNTQDLIALSQTNKQCLKSSAEYVSYWLNATKFIKPAYFDRILPWSAYTASELRLAARRSLQASHIWMKSPYPEPKIGVQFSELSSQQMEQRAFIYIVPGTRWAFSYNSGSIHCIDLRTGSFLGSFSPPSDEMEFINYAPIRDSHCGSPNEVTLILNLMEGAERTFIYIYILRFTDNQLPEETTTSTRPQHSGITFQVEIQEPRIECTYGSWISLSQDGRLLAVVEDIHEIHLDIHCLSTRRKIRWDNVESSPECMVFRRDMLLLLSYGSLYALHAPSVFKVLEETNIEVADEASKLDTLLSKSEIINTDTFDEGPVDEISIIAGDSSESYDDNQNAIVRCIVEGIVCQQYAFTIALQAGTDSPSSSSPSLPLEQTLPRGYYKPNFTNVSLATTVRLPRFADPMTTWSTQRTILSRKYHPMIDMFAYNMHVSGVDQPGEVRPLITPKTLSDRAVPWILEIEETSGVTIMKDDEAWVACWFA